MAELKTKQNDGSVDDLLDAVPDPQKAADARVVLGMMQEATGGLATLWGSNIVGFGRYHYTYASGREGDWFLCGFSPRKANLTLYIMPGFSAYEDLLGRLGKHKTGKSCLYIKRLSDVDVDVLRELVEASVVSMRQRYPECE